MKSKNIKTTFIEYLNEKNVNNKSWYHGTPDGREIEKEGGFSDKTMSVKYITDIDAYNNLLIDIQNSRENSDMNLYHKLLNKVDKYKKDFVYKKPLFLTDNYSVAKTYANPNRAFDYQNAIEKVYEVDVNNCSKVVEIIATGDRFRFISIDKVKRGFMNSGISENEIDKLISMFNYYISDKGIKTDVIAAIGNWLGFDCIDVIGVLDSYQGGNVKSTVRMVLNPSNVKLK